MLQIQPLALQRFGHNHLPRSDWLANPHLAGFHKLAGFTQDAVIDAPSSRASI